MDNHKLVTIFILHDKIQFCFFRKYTKKKLQNLVVFTKKIFFFYVFEMRNCFRIFWICFEFSEKTITFNTSFVSYSANLRSDIKQSSKKIYFYVF
jgi:hypothetical protein